MVFTEVKKFLAECLDNGNYPFVEVILEEGPVLSQLKPARRRAKIVEMSREEKKIPALTEKQRKGLSELNRDALRKMAGDIPRTVDLVNQQKDSPLHVISVIMFIWHADKHIIDQFDPINDQYTRFSFVDGISTALAYMRRYPGINDLSVLFGAVKEEYLKNPTSFSRPNILPPR